MARIRTIKPEFWTDSKIVRLSPTARLLFIGIWNFADDYGCVEADPFQLKLKVLPAEPCDPDPLLDELHAAGLLVTLTNGTDTFWQVRGWEKHQKIDRRSKPTYGDPDSWHPAAPSPSPAEPPRIPPSPRDGREGKGRDQGREQPLAPAKPTQKKVRQPDLLFAAVTQACGIDPSTLTDSGRGAVNKALKELRQVGANPDEVASKAVDYRKRYPDAGLTPSALAKHWGSLNGRVAGRARGQPVFGSPEWQRQQAEARRRAEQAAGVAS
jgi:hypothetical protein